MNTAQTIYGEVQSGDWVIAAGNNEHRYLLGVVTAIDKLGAPEHGTENETDDIHVDFAAFGYPPDRIVEIEGHFSDLYGEPKTFDELPLDDVIMAPDMLIRITHLGNDEMERMGNLRLNCESFCNCFPGAALPQSDKHGELLARLKWNLETYHASLLGFSKQELIDMAEKISSMSTVHDYLACRRFDDKDLDFLLQFQNPLEVAANNWLGYMHDMDDELGDALDVLFGMNDFTSIDKEDLLGSYPLMSDAAPPPLDGQHRFMGVDLVDFLGKISDKVIVHYPGDWKIDVEHLNRVAGSGDPEEKRLMWHVSSWGTHMNTERDTFIKDTGAFNTWVDYRPNDPDMLGYAVEITGRAGNAVIGNVFELGDYADHARYVRETALLLEFVSLTYTNDWGVNAGKTITVPRFEYDDDRHRLCSESGNVHTIRYHPWEGMRSMDSLLRMERSRRMAYPIGSMEAHLQKLTEKLAEIREPVVETPRQEKSTRPTAAKKKPSIMERLAEADAEAKAYNAQRAQSTVSTTKNKKKEIE